MDAVQLAAGIAAVLLVGVAAFQAGLAAGAPWGEMSYGGRAETVDGVLPASHRAMSAVAVVVLSLAAWIVLARAGVVAAGPLSAGFLRGATWFVVAYLVVNTVANLASTHPGERFGLGSVTFVAAIACSVVARSPIDLVTSA